MLIGRFLLYLSIISIQSWKVLESGIVGPDPITSKVSPTTSDNISVTKFDGLA